MSVSIRKVEEPQYDGSTGEQTDTHVRYELGGEVDGVFIPFANVRESFVKHTQDLDAWAKEKTKAAKSNKATADETTGES